MAHRTTTTPPIDEARIRKLEEEIRRQDWRQGCHEAGHAIAHLLHPGASILDAVVLWRGTKRFPIAGCHYRSPRHPNRKQGIALAVACYAGEVAEMLADPGAEREYLSETLERTSDEIWRGEAVGDDYCMAALHLNAVGLPDRAEECRRIAQVLVRERWAEIEAVARALVARGRLTGKQASAIARKTRKESP